MAEPEKVTPIKPQAEGELPVRKLPANLEAEAAFLGAVLIDSMGCSTGGRSARRR